MFKIQCEYMDQKLRESITSGLQKHATLRVTIQNEDSSSDSNGSEDAVTASYEANSMRTTMEEFESILPDINKYQRSEQTSSDQYGQTYSQFNLFNQNHQAAAAPSQENPDENAMDVSPPKNFDVDSLPNVKANVDESTDQEMYSVKSDSESLPVRINCDRMLSCKICSATFLIQSEYNKHLKNHSDYRYQCSVCSRWFEKRYQLNTHHKTHNGVKSVKCSLCEKQYTSQTNLDRHIRIMHKQERQHTCSTCQKTFAQLASLRIHQSVHEAERKFGCDICNHKFKSEIHLKLHKKRHLPTEYRLKRRSSLPKKPTYKSPPKLCVCNECGKRFTSIAMLRSHMQLVYKVCRFLNREQQ